MQNPGQVECEKHCSW